MYSSVLSNLINIYDIFLKLDKAKDASDTCASLVSKYELKLLALSDEIFRQNNNFILKADVD